MLLHAKSKGLDATIGERGVRMSGGERQRLALARSFLSKPTLLILDEATSALDAISEKKISLALQKFSKDMTVIIIAHRLSSIKYADHIVVLDKGKVADRGDWQSLSSKDKGLFQSLLKQSSL
jgi:ATP-binding cassette subfamily C protein